MMPIMSAKPSRLAPTAASVIQPLVVIIMKRLPKKRTTAESREPTLWLSDCPSMSTSLVMRERMSPVGTALKYDMGRRLIFAEMSARMLRPMRCVTVVIIHPWTTVRM